VFDLAKTSITMSEPATLIETFTGLYGAYPTSGKHITFFHPKDERINSRASLLTNIGKSITVRVYDSLVEWENQEGQQFAYRHCRYFYPNGEQVMGHISEKVTIKGGDPKENKGHSETTKNWEDFVRDGKNDTYEEFTSFGCVLRSSRHQKAVDNKTLANEILTAFDARVLIDKNGTITPFGETLSKTQLNTVPILISDIGVEGDEGVVYVEKLKDMKDMLQLKFQYSDFIIFDDIVERDFKHIVSDHIKVEHIKSMIITSPPQ
jgi:hypothetical protein